MTILNRNRTSKAAASALSLMAATCIAAVATAQHQDPNAARPESPLDAIAYLEAHRDDVAMVLYTVGEDGEPVDDGHSFFFNDDLPMPLASTAKIAILAAYAREVAEGRIDPEHQIQMGEWDQYYLPGTDGGAHASALKDVQVAMDEDGFATDPFMLVPIRRVVFAMMRHSDNAAADLLLRRIGHDAVAETMREAGVELELNMPSFLGLILFWQNHERPELNDDGVRTLLDLDPEMRILEMRRLQNRYMTDDWRRAEVNWRRSHTPTPESVLHQAMFADETGPVASARAVARLLALAASDQFLSPKASEVMRTHLEWPMGVPGTRRSFTRMGAKGGALAGVITDSSYLIMRQGDFQGEMRVSALLMRRVPIEAWGTMMTTFAHQQAALGAAGHPGFLARMREALEVESESAED